MGEARRPTGTGNITVMLDRGYIETLFQTADTPLGREFATALQQHSGVHLIAFAAAQASEQHRRLGDTGFRTRPIVELKRSIQTENGTAEAAFTVVRVESGEMKEGRIQFLTHRTEDTVWQKRWLAHKNGVWGLFDVVIVVSDVAEAAERYGRFLARPPVRTPIGQGIFLDRGAVQFTDEMAYQSLVPGGVPNVPFIGLYALGVESLDKVEALLAHKEVKAERQGRVLIARFPPSLGKGAWFFTERIVDLPWSVS